MNIEIWYVECGLIQDSDGIYNFYMDKRRELFGYANTPPTLRTLIRDGNIQLSAAAPGALETSEQADILLVELRTTFPSNRFRVANFEYENVQGITWNKA